MESETLVRLIIISIDLVLGLVIGFRISKNKSKKRNILWGLVTMVVIAPLLSMLVAYFLSLILGSIFLIDPLTGVVILVYIFPFLFFVGLGRLLFAVFRTKNSHPG